jgi:hypothetical protein
VAALPPELPAFLRSADAAAEVGSSRASRPLADAGLVHDNERDARPLVNVDDQVWSWAGAS